MSDEARLTPDELHRVEQVWNELLARKDELEDALRDLRSHVAAQERRLFQVSGQIEVLERLTTPEG